MGWVVDDEPRKKTCGLRKGKCERCANCKRDWWATVYRSLKFEDREWLREQLAEALSWGGVFVERGQSSWTWCALGEPGLTRYVLK